MGKSLTMGQQLTPPLPQPSTPTTITKILMMMMMMMIIPLRPSAFLLRQTKKTFLLILLTAGVEQKIYFAQPTKKRKILPINAVGVHINEHQLTLVVGFPNTIKITTTTTTTAIMLLLELVKKIRPRTTEWKTK